MSTSCSVAPSESAGITGRLVQELAERWRQGECPPVEEFFHRHPELNEQPERAVRLIYEEICLRQEAGQPGASVEALRRFPQWRDQLAVLLDCHRLLSIGLTPPQFPNVGECLGDFRLLAELGRGAQGRVFLSTQPSLCDRPIVLKLTPCDGHEHLSLARLQHTYIVPLYSVHQDPARNLRALCMPFFGGTTLAMVLESIQDKPFAERRGEDILRVLDAVQAAMPVRVPSMGPTREFFARAPYVRAICGIGVCLAEALHYAHEHGLVHLDLKPSNVLLAADGQPMLLDFHLAQEPIPALGPIPGWLGGTPAYMSPEQAAAVAALQEGQTISQAVDARSDLYSLGLLLYEALGGPRPASPDGRPPLHSCNPQISVGLSDLIARCLEPDARQRYASAAGLAEDLRRHLEHRPLQGVANRSLAERWHKWCSRHRQALVWTGRLLLVLAGALAAGAALTYISRLRDDALAALADGQQRLKNDDAAEAVRMFTRGLALTEHLPGNSALKQALRAHLARARRAQTAQELHRLADRLRFLYGIDSLPGPGLRALEQHVQAVWEFRGTLIHRSELDAKPEWDKQIRWDLIDLVVLWMDLRVRLAPPGPAAGAQREALRVLAEAEALLGPCHILCREQQRYAEALGFHELAGAAAHRAKHYPPQTAWDHYTLGQSLLRSGELAAAVAEFDQALAQRPQDFWPQLYRGICAYRLQDYGEAVSAFNVCIALAPEVGEGYYDRALAGAALGRTDQALRDFDRAVQLNSGLRAGVALNRGIIYWQTQRYPLALHELEASLDQGADPAAVYYYRALVCLAQKERSEALANLSKALQYDPHHDAARALLERLKRDAKILTIDK
jgi:serine/threonine protein kinase/Flp pilus assembly protein TadD